LFDRRLVVGVVLVEQRLALSDLVAAPHAKGREEPRLGRPDLDEIGVRVALPLDRLRPVRSHKDPPAGDAGGDQSDGEEQASAHDLTYCNETI